MTEQRIPFFRPSIDEDDVAAVAGALRSGWLTSGPNVRALEEELSTYCGAPYVNAMNSCTAAMHLALEAWDIGPGDEVITTPYTFSATGAVIVHAGATPVLADILPDTGNIDPAAIERAITPKTKAIMPVHLAGEPCDMEAITGIAQAHGLKVLEDAAHAIGTRYRGQPVGSLSDAAAFSFYATKNITTAEGGALATADQALSDRVRTLTLHGMTKDAWNRYDAGGSWRYDVVEFGFKDNLTDLCAALGRTQLRRVDALREGRTRAALRYLDNLGGEELLQLPVFDARNTQAWHLFIIHVRPGAPVGRDDVIRGLAERGIGTSVHFIPLHYHTAFRKLGYWQKGDFPVAEAFFEGAITLPLYPDMTDEDVDYVSEALRDVLGGV